MTLKVAINGLETYAYHGVGKEENILGKRFIVDLDATLEVQAPIEDKLEDTLNYQCLSNAVQKNFKEPAKLIEHVAYKICKELFEQYDIIRALRIYIQKIDPPIHTLASSSSAELTITREEFSKSLSKN